MYQEVINLIHCQEASLLPGALSFIIAPGCPADSGRATKVRLLALTEILFMSDLELTLFLFGDGQSKFSTNNPEKLAFSSFEWDGNCRESSTSSLLRPILFIILFVLSAGDSVILYSLSLEVFAFG